MSMQITRMSRSLELSLRYTPMRGVAVYLSGLRRPRPVAQMLRMMLKFLLFEELLLGAGARQRLLSE